MTRQELLLGALAGVFLAIHFATWISSLEYTSIASSVVLVSTGPLWVALVSPFFLREQLTRTALSGLGLAIIGGVIIAGADACRWDTGLRCVGLDQFVHGRAIWGNFLALLGAWAVSGYLVLGRRLRPSVPLVPYILVAYGSAAICLVIAMLALGETPFGLTPVTYFWILLLAIVPQLIGHSTYNWALGFLPAALVAVTTLGEPIGSAALAFTVLKETPGLPVLCGGALILAGIYLAARRPQQASSPLP
jgi:drug/metabolite transporter (DMT)-like permease